MDLSRLAPPDDPRRLAVRAWLALHPSPTGRQLAEAGYVVPHWPAPFGLEADPVHQLLIDDELSSAGVTRPGNPIGIGWAAPTIALAGTEAQKQRWIWPALAGEEFWCQLFSEPDAGSDLASLSTRAVRDGDEWVVNGSKIWTSGGHLARWGILIARTDPDAPKHRGISYFVCPMDAPGLTMQPIIDMTTAHSFNQVFFDDVRLPADHLIGEPGDGWRLAKATLANERVSLSSGGVLWGSGPRADDLVDLVRSWRGDGAAAAEDGAGAGVAAGVAAVAAGRGGLTDPLERQELARVVAESSALDGMRQRTLAARLKGRTPGPEASVQKLFADEHGQRVMELAKSLAGTSGVLDGSGPAGPPLRAAASRGAVGVAQAGATGSDGGVTEGVDPVWHHGFLFAPALTIGGGTWAVQRNIVGERVLGLPAEPDLQRGVPWSQSRGGTAGGAG